MRLIHRLVFVSSILVLAHCGSDAVQGPVEPEPPEQSADRTDDELETPDEAPEATAAAGVTVTRVSGTDEAPATSGAEALSVTARVEGDAVVVAMTGYVYYCSPAPRFRGRIEDEKLFLELEDPSGPVTRCVGPHRATLRVEGAASASTLVLEGQTGREPTEVAITPAG